MNEELLDLRHAIEEKLEVTNHNTGQLLRILGNANLPNIDGIGIDIRIVMINEELKLIRRRVNLLLGIIFLVIIVNIIHHW